MNKVVYVILTAVMIPVVTIANCALTGSGMVGDNAFNGVTACSGSDSDSVTVNGPLTVSNTKINSVTLNGTLNINKATISSGTISGNIIGNNANLGDITVSGNVNLSSSNLKNLTVSGNINLSDGSLGNMTVSGTAQLKNVKVNSISASGGGWFSGPSKIYLSNGTIVAGNITFTNGNQGVVIMSSGAKVLGSITGGKVENQ